MGGTDPDDVRRLVAVGGGKGGVGKSVVAVALAGAFARTGRNVALVDLDLGAGNLHTYLGQHEDRPGVADFLSRKAPDLAELLQPSGIPGVGLISGARFYPGMANPAYQSKIKLIRHLRRLPVDVVVLDLGAGVHYNVLDFFAVSRPGLLVLAPEAGSVLNAYSFVKGSVFRRLHRVYGRHPELGPTLREQSERGDDAGFSVEAFRQTVAGVDVSLAPLVDEILAGLDLALVMNQVTDLVSAVFADNLQKLVLQRLGLRVRYLGNLPRIRGLAAGLPGLPDFLETPSGRPLSAGADELVAEINGQASAGAGIGGLTEPETPGSGHPFREDYSDEDLQILAALLDQVGPVAFRHEKKAAWKLRLYYRPQEVVRFLYSEGVEHEVFYGSGNG